MKLLLLVFMSEIKIIRKRYSFTAGLTERVFLSSHGEAQPRTHNPTATFCIIMKLLLPLDHGASQPQKALKRM